MFDDLGDGQATDFLLAIGIVGVALFALFAVFWLIRRRSNSTFIRGGKNRQPRLAVLDAAAVDTRRRLVLVRRDSVEHLILIGGPTDIVVESRISQTGSIPISANEELPALEDASTQITGDQPPARLQPPEKAPSAKVETPAKPVFASPSAKPAETDVKHSSPTTAPAANVTGGLSAGPVATASAAAVAARAETDNALDALDAARNRVLADSSETAQSAKPITTTSPEAAPGVQDKPVFIADAYFENAATPSPSRPTTTEPTATSGAASVAPPRMTPHQPESSELQPEMTDFEAILEAELAEDLELAEDHLVGETSGDEFSDAIGDLSRVTPDKDSDTASATDKPTRLPSDTLEDEMDKLLGDLSRHK